MTLIRTGRPSWALSRRTLLRGAGSLVALPLLDAMLHARPARAQQQPPRRFLAFYVPNGIHMPAWTPASDGPLTTAPPTLAPLQSHLDDVLVLTGLDNFAATAQGDGPGDHARGTGCFLTATHLKKTDGADIQNGISVDQAIANALRGQTALSSLELGCDGGVNTGGCDSGYSCAYSRNISWAGPSTPMPKEINPRAAFERLFADTTNESAAERERRIALSRSVLDFTKADAAALHAKMGARDRQKLDEYLTGVRDLERRLDVAAGACEAPEQPLGVPAEHEEHTRLLLDIAATAFACDLTRVATFMLSNGGSGRSYRFIGVNDNHHEISHHGRDADKQAKLQAINTWEVGQLAWLLDRLKAMEEGEGSVLSSSSIFFSSEIEDGDSHSHRNLPIIVAGQGGGDIRTGRHLRLPAGTPVANLFLRFIASTAGQAPDRFGDDGTAPLDLS